MLATEVTENTEDFSFGAASAANSSRSDGLFAAKAASTFTVVQIKTTKQAFASVPKFLAYQPTMSGEVPFMKAAYAPGQNSRPVRSAGAGVYNRIREAWSPGLVESG